MNKIDPPVCIVDDDSSIRESLQDLLRAEGIRVEPYCSAREFLARGNAEPAGCLVLDVDLPGVSGLQLQREPAEQLLRLGISAVGRRGRLQQH